MIRWRRRADAAVEPDPFVHVASDVVLRPLDHRADDDVTPPPPDEMVLAELSQAFGRGGVEATGAPRDTPAGVGHGPGRQVIKLGSDVDADADAVYLDELVEPAVGSTGQPEGTVFIDDGDSSDAQHLGGRKVGGAIEPRLRTRRIGVRRAAGRRRLRMVLVVAGVLVGLVTILAILGSSLFAVDDVDVSGAVYADRTQLAAVIADIDGTPVLLVDTDAAERRLEAIPWVDEARVRTHFPDRVTIELRERTPILTMQGTDQRYRVLDREGRVLAAIDGRPVDPVLVTGPGFLDLGPGDYAPVGYVAAAELVTRLTPEVRVRLDTMQVNPGGTDLRMLVRNEPWPSIEVRFGSVIGGEQQVEKLVLLQRQLGDLDGAPVQRIDVSTSEVTQIDGVAG